MEEQNRYENLPFICFVDNREGVAVIEGLSLGVLVDHLLVLHTYVFAEDHRGVVRSDFLEVIGGEGVVGGQLVDLRFDIDEVPEAVVEEGVAGAAAVGVLEVFLVFLVVLGQVVEVVVQEVHLKWDKLQ